MKEFSNETKSKRTKAILRVILKRYSFIVWVPALLQALNFIGKVTYKFLRCVEEGGILYNYFLNIIMGFFVIGFIISVLMLVLITLHSLLKYLKKGTIIKDSIYNIKLITEALVDIFHFFISLPKRIFLRIKDEKRRFNNSLEKELGRNEND